MSSIKNMIQDAVYTGIGMAVETREMVEKWAKDMTQKNQMSAEEGKKFVDEIKERYDKTQEKFECRVEDAVKNVMKKTDMVTADEIKALKKEIRDLKSLINEKLQ